MKKISKIFGVVAFAAAMMLQGCGMSNTGKGALIGGGGGGALGAGIGALIGKGSGKGTAIGAAVGTAVGAGVGAIIGNKMDKHQKELEAQLAEQAKIEQVTDENGLRGIKVTFDGGILFPTGKWSINANAQKELDKFAASLVNNPDTDIWVCGFTDNTGTMAANEKVSTNRANAVKDYLVKDGVAATRIDAKGYPMTNYIADNSTKAGQAQNRRVEIYITANEDMIKKAEAEAEK